MYNKSSFKKKIALQKFCVIFKCQASQGSTSSKWLINNSALYKEEGIALCENWQNSKESDFENSVHDKSECNHQVEPSNTNSETLSTYNEEKRCNDSDEWSENETESPASVTDTLLTSADFVEDNEWQYIPQSKCIWGQILRRNGIPRNSFGPGTGRK